MSETSFTGSNYEIVAWARGQKTIYYAQFGSYQGEWVLLSKKGIYTIYKGWYGSCSGCDHYEAEIGYSENATLEKAQEFAKDYSPFLEVPVETMVNIVNAGNLIEIFPANIREEWSEINYSEAVADMNVAIKLEEDLEITADDVLTVFNAELQQRALKKLSYEKFVARTNAFIIDEVDGDKLIRLDRDDEPFTLAYVKDSSTDRRYFLRVPPHMTKLKAALAWTFGLEEDQYKPIIET